MTRILGRALPNGCQRSENPTPVVEAPPKVVNLMDALRKSLDTVSAGRKKPAKTVAEARPAQKRKRA